jgi:hypothetical protein
MTETEGVHEGEPPAMIKLTVTAEVVPADRHDRAYYKMIPVIAYIDVYPESGSLVTKLVKIYPPNEDRGEGITKAVLKLVTKDWDEILFKAIQQAGLAGEGAKAEAEFRALRGKADAPTQRREMTESHLSKVAEVYRRAEQAGGSPAPLRAVMAAFPGRNSDRVSKSTAARWIKEARQVGLLEEREP